MKKMEQRLYKAHVVHPLTNVPLVVSFNAHSGLVSFEKDEEVLSVMTSLKGVLPLEVVNDIHQNQTDHITKSSYPADTIEDVFDFLEKIGIDRYSVQFISIPLQ